MDIDLPDWFNVWNVVAVLVLLKSLSVLGRQQKYLAERRREQEERRRG